MERINGVVIGLVTDLSDPEGLGRIRVSFPWLGDNVQSNWARIAAPMAGGERGVFFQPEIGDEALVAFEQGEVRSPYILGFLWNGDDKPPRDNSKIRIIKTVSGHFVEFDDEAGKITINDKSSHTIVMDDNGIKLTVGSNTIEMMSSGITLTVGANTLGMTSSGIKLTVGGSSIDTTASGIKLQAPGIDLN
jgi:uncharacterized protein involved in type VI secretion and phage assembly